ncbi:MAG: hemolysin family protein [Candidatus Sericytochromatia bacterium]|nr:hemolysin family protein [Candidatus Sericytochromatia bacterium]
MDPGSPNGLAHAINISVPPIEPGTAAFVVALCIVGTAFFSSSEAAIITLSKHRIRHLAEQGRQDAVRLQGLIQARERLVGTILLAENGLIIIASTVLSLSVYQAMSRGFFGTAWAQWPIAPWLAIAGVALAMIFLVVLVAEIIPKSAGAANAERYALLVSRPLRWTAHLLWFPVWCLTAAARAYVQLVNTLSGSKGEMALPLVAEDELRQLIADVREHGGLQQEETEMIESVIELRDTTAREIMVPRIDMVCVPADCHFDEALRVAITEGHSRIPVYEESPDNIIGLLYAKDLLGVLQGDYRPASIPLELVRPPFHVPESKRVDELLKLMRTEKVHLAIVLDEFGGTAGLVTIEDILEEIVGEIRDEYDAEEPAEIDLQSDGTLVVDGRANIDDVSAKLGAQLPTDDFDTIGGFVVGLLGRAPLSGEEVTWEGVRLQIEQVENRRVSRVRIWRRHTAPLEIQEPLNEDVARRAI